MSGHQRDFIPPGLSSQDPQERSHLPNTSTQSSSNQAHLHADLRAARPAVRRYGAQAATQPGLTMPQLHGSHAMPQIQATTGQPSTLFHAPRNVPEQQNRRDMPTRRPRTVWEDMLEAAARLPPQNTSYVFDPSTQRGHASRRWRGASRSVIQSTGSTQDTRSHSSAAGIDRPGDLLTPAAEAHRMAVARYMRDVGVGPLAPIRPRSLEVPPQALPRHSYSAADDEFNMMDSNINESITSQPSEPPDASIADGTPQTGGSQPATSTDPTIPRETLDPSVGAPIVRYKSYNGLPPAGYAEGQETLPDSAFIACVSPHIPAGDLKTMRQNIQSWEVCNTTVTSDPLARQLLKDRKVELARTVMDQCFQHAPEAFRAMVESQGYPGPT
jgi:hypothetical protein